MDVEGLGEAAIGLAAFAGLELDPWQQLVLKHMLSTTDETYYNEFTESDMPMWAAGEYGLCVPRQNGKNSILEARELAGLFLLGERLIIHTAHQFDTCLEAFRRILQLIEQTPDLDALVARVVRNHGEEGVELKSGQRLRFRTRTNGGGRGFSPDCVIFDEAMKSLGGAEIAAILPSVSARPNPQFIYTGSAGNENAEQFGAVRARVMREEPIEEGIWSHDPSMGWAEWSGTPCGYYCPADCTDHDRPEDIESHAKVNPAMGYRLTPEHTMKEYRAMPLPEFLCERLGVGKWPSEGGGWKVIPKQIWRDQADDVSVFKGKLALAVDSAPNNAMSCISAVGMSESETIKCEITHEGVGEAAIYDYRPGVRWVIPRVRAIWAANRPAFVVIDPASPAGVLIQELESYGIKVVGPTIREFGQACSDIQEGFAPTGGAPATHVHADQAPLNTAVAQAEMLPFQDLWRLSKSASSADITPFTCITLANWGFKKHIYRKTSKPWAVRRAI